MGQHVSTGCLARFERRLATELPRWNNGVESGAIRADDLITFARNVTDEIVGEAAPRVTMIDRETALKVIQLLGFVVSSVERHFLVLGRARGEGLALLPGVEALLVASAPRAQHPPRDQHDTYWYRNTGPEPLTFTGHPGEVLFNRVVNLTRELQLASCDALRPICRGDVSVTDPVARQALAFVAENTAHLHDAMASFKAKAEAGEWKLPIRVFTERMRTYLVAYPIEGTIWEGPNATNVAPAAQIDFLVGTVDDEYRDTVRGRFRYMADEEREALKADMELRSVGDALLERLGLTAHDIETLEVKQLAGHIAAQPLEMVSVLGAYADVIDAAGSLSGLHFGHINRYLIKHAEGLTPEQIAAMPVPPTTGVGLNSHEHTRRIMMLRVQHPIFGKLAKAVELYQSEHTK